MNCREWIEQLEKLAPVFCACDWDNPGLLAGRSDKEIRKVLVALDATDEVVELAVREKVDLLLTHHPLIFKPLKKINDQDFIGARLVKLIQADICYYAMHTNFDAAPGCMADMAAKKLHLVETEPLEVLGEMDGTPYGIGKTGILLKSMPLEELARAVKEEFGIPFVTVYGAKQFTGLVRRVAICPGSGKGMTKEALAFGAQVLITGDIGHHDGIDAVAEGLVIMDAGHYGLEHMFVDFMADYCMEKIDFQAEIVKAPVEFPVEAW